MTPYNPPQHDDRWKQAHSQRTRNTRSRRIKSNETDQLSQKQNSLEHQNKAEELRNGSEKGVGQSQGNWYGRHKRQKDRHGRHKSHLILAWVWQNHKTPTSSIQRPKSILYLQALLLPPNKQTLWWTVLLTSGIAMTIPFELIYFCRKKGMRGKWENDRDGGG